MIRMPLVWLLVTVFVVTSGRMSFAQQPQLRRLPMARYVDKMEAGWIGQMVGVGWGGPTEFKYQGVIIPADALPKWRPAMVNQFNQDDIYVEMTFLRTLEQYGLDATIRQAGIDFANSGYRLWHANLAGRNNLRRGIAPPDSSHPQLNKHGGFAGVRLGIRDSNPKPFQSMPPSSPQLGSIRRNASRVLSGPMHYPDGSIRITPTTLEVSRSSSDGTASPPHHDPSAALDFFGQTASATFKDYVPRAHARGYILSPLRGLKLEAVLTYKRQGIAPGIESFTIPLLG
jgi:hypothetical protein